MSIRILSPEFSFIQFSESDSIEDCQTGPLLEVLPVVEDSDIWFQFILETDTAPESDDLCGDTGTLVRVGIANSCIENNALTFSELPERYRIDDTHVLYNWVHGFPLFQTVIDDGECFLIKISIFIAPNYNFCSGYFKRSVDTCFTSVFEYGNDDNFADFNYCGGVSIDQAAADCTPTEITFSNQLNISIPYTAMMLAKYGDVPSVKVWIYNDDGVLADIGILVVLDAFPPSTIYADFGGLASGVVKIS